MLCVGKAGLPPGRELGVVNQHENAALPASGRRLGYAPFMKFRSSKVVIDLYPQDYCIQPKVFALAGRESQLEPGRFGRVVDTDGLRRAEWVRTGRRADSKVRAERVSRRPPLQQTSGERPNVWDANAENVRRPRLPRNSEAENDDPTAFFGERSNGSTGREWDYEAEDDWEPRESDGWRRWLPRNLFNDTYEEEEEADDEDEEEEDLSWFSWLNLDLRQALTLLQWGIPAALLLGSATIASLIGNPLMLLLGFSFFPSAANFFKKVVRSVANPFVGRTRRRSRRPRASDGRTQETARSMDFGSPSSSRRYGAPGAGRATDLGGWDDLVESRLTPKRQSSSWPAILWKGPSKSQQKREQPLVIRIILALFPFLRAWGGLL